jgi:peptidoglycan/xylan/chitin deacetylase (PgdA/CDA1 family)
MSRTTATNRETLKQNYLINDGELITTKAVNLVTNGSMELDSNWTDWNLEAGDTNERSSTRAKEGTYSRHIVVDATSEGATSDNFDVVSGKTYRVSCWAWVVSGVAQFRRNAARLDFTIASTTTGQWEYIYDDVVASATGAEKFRLEATGAAEYYVDDVKVVEQNFVEDETGGFEDLSEWTVTGTGASIEADTVNFKEGTQGIKITSTNAASAYAISPDDAKYDLSGNNRFSAWVYIDDVSKMFQSGVALFYFYTGSVDYFIYSVTGSKLRTGWNRIVFNKDDFTENNSPDWNNPVIQIRIRALSLSGETVNLTVDDLRIERYEKPKVVVSFDDGNLTDYTEAFAYMETLGLKGTSFTPGDNVGLANQMTLAQLKELYAAGWDIGNHSYSHVDLTSLTDAQVKAEITTEANYLINNGMPRAAYMLAWPFSALNDATVESVREAGIIVGRTGTNDISPHEIQEKLKLNRGTVSNTSSIADLTGYADNVIENGGVLVYNFHDIVNPADSLTDCLPATFKAVMDYLKLKQDQGMLDVVTISEWYNGLDGRRKSATSRVESTDRITI